MEIGTRVGDRSRELKVLADYVFLIYLSRFKANIFFGWISNPKIIQSKHFLVGYPTKKYDLQLIQSKQFFGWISNHQIVCFDFLVGYPTKKIVCFEFVGWISNQNIVCFELFFGWISNPKNVCFDFFGWISNQTIVCFELFGGFRLLIFLTQKDY